MSKDDKRPVATILDIASLGTDFSQQDVEKSANRAVLPTDSHFVELYGMEVPTELDPAQPLSGVGYKVRAIIGMNKDGTFIYGAEWTWNSLFNNLARFNPAAKPELKDGQTLEEVMKTAKEKATAQNARAFGELLRNMTDGKAEIGENMAAMQAEFNRHFAAGRLPIGIYNPSTNQPSYKSSYKDKKTNTQQESVKRDLADLSWGATTRNSAITSLKKGTFTPPDVRDFIRSMSTANMKPKTDNAGGGNGPGGIGSEPPADE